MKQPSNKTIRHLLSDRMPTIPWVFKRNLCSEKSGWRVFSGKRNGIKYTVQVLSWWAEDDRVKRPTFVFFVDDQCELKADGIFFSQFVERCVSRIRQMAHQAEERASKLRMAVES